VLPSHLIFKFHNSHLKKNKFYGTLDSKNKLKFEQKLEEKHFKFLESLWNKRPKEYEKFKIEKIKHINHLFTIRPKISSYVEERELKEIEYGSLDSKRKQKPHKFLNGVFNKLKEKSHILIKETEKEFKKI